MSKIIGYVVKLKNSNRYLRESTFSYPYCFSQNNDKDIFSSKKAAIKNIKAKRLPEEVIFQLEIVEILEGESCSIIWELDHLIKK